MTLEPHYQRFPLHPTQVYCNFFQMFWRRSSQPSVAPCLCLWLMQPYMSMLLWSCVQCKVCFCHRQKGSEVNYFAMVWTDIVLWCFEKLMKSLSQGLVLFMYSSKHIRGHMIACAVYLQKLLTTSLCSDLDVFKILSIANERLFCPAASLEILGASNVWTVCPIHRVSSTANFSISCLN